MPNPMQVIDKLQQLLFVQNELKDRDDYVDVPYVDDDEYRTNRAFGEEELKEDEDDEAELNDLMAGEGGEEAPPEEAAVGGEETAMGAEPGADMGMGMGGMPGEVEPLTVKQIGRVYELKKVYARLTSIEKHLADVSDPEMIELRQNVGNALDLFKTITANFEQYKDDLDEIIVTYYKFIDTAYNAVKTFYKQHKGQEE